MRLTAPDEYFNHQTSFPHAVVGSSDPNWRERYWISVQDVRRDDFILSFGFGKYPNQDVAEGFAIVLHGERQHNLRLSQELSSAGEGIGAGVLRAEILEPFRHLRFSLDDNPSGIAFDLHWTGSATPMLEGRHLEVNRNRVTHDLSRYVQLGRVAGTVRTPDGDVRLDFETGWGERDHSWGTRPMASVPGAPPIHSAPWNFLAFCPIQFPSFSLHFYLFEAQRGRPTHMSVAISRPEGTTEADELDTVEHDLEWDYAAPVMTLAGGTLTLVFYNGRRLPIVIRARRPRVFLLGGGYGKDQGQWKGVHHLEHESWDLSDPDAVRTYAAGSSDHMIEATCNGETGYGIIEYIVRKDHRKYHRSHRAASA